MGGWVGDHAQMHGLHCDAMELNVFFCAHSRIPPDVTHARLHHDHDHDHHHYHHHRHQVTSSLCEVPEEDPAFAGDGHRAPGVLAEFTACTISAASIDHSVFSFEVAETPWQELPSVPGGGDDDDDDAAVAGAGAAAAKSGSGIGGVGGGSAANGKVAPRSSEINKPNDDSDDLLEQLLASTDTGRDQEEEEEEGEGVGGTADEVTAGGDNTAEMLALLDEADRQHEREMQDLVALEKANANAAAAAAAAASATAAAASSTDRQSLMGMLSKAAGATPPEPSVAVTPPVAAATRPQRAGTTSGVSTPPNVQVGAVNDEPLPNITHNTHTHTHTHTTQHHPPNPHATILEHLFALHPSIIQRFMRVAPFAFFLTRHHRFATMLCRCINSGVTRLLCPRRAIITLF